MYAPELKVPPALDAPQFQNRTPPSRLPKQPATEALPDPLTPPPDPEQAPPAPLPDQGSPDPAARADQAVTVVGDRVTLVVRDESLAVVLGMIAEQHRLNVVSGDEVTGRLTVTLNDVPLDDALDSILTANGYTWTRHRDILTVSRIATDTRLSPVAQGRVMRVFQLNFTSATDIDRVVQGLLSPVGQSVVTETSPEHSRRTREEIVVEDLPAYLARIESYISQADVPPRQVHVEAHVLQIVLEDDSQHGVNLNQLLRLSNTDIRLRTIGFADPLASPTFFLGIDGTDLNGLIQCLKTTTDAKTLASPKVMVLNGQEARIQVGESLGYLVTTTTQTSTLQNVDFLDVGVVLNVTPQISDDGRIMMKVKPEVSGGRINPDTGLPDKSTTEVETTIMLNDGQGMVIGGLIREEVTEIQNKLPIAGDLWLIGRAFQRRTLLKQRNEYIIALLPRIVPCATPMTDREHMELQQSETPLLDGALHRVDRRAWEAQLPDAMRDPRRPDFDRLHNWMRNTRNEYPYPKSYYYPSVNEKREGRYAD